MWRVFDKWNICDFKVWKINDFDDEATRWLCIWYTCIYVKYKYDSDMSFQYLMMMLRSTMGFYGRPITEVAYGKMLLSLHRDCMGVDSSGRVVGVSTWCRPCWTYPGQHQCGLNVFFDFQYIKPMYMYNVFKIYM